MNLEQLSEYHALLQRFALSTVEECDHDLVILRYMALVALDAAWQLDAKAPSDEPIVIRMSDIPGGLKTRVVTNTSGPLHLSSMPFVGFISKKHMHIEQEIQNRINGADSGMLLELARIPTLLSYVSLQLADENWYNLVLFSQESAKHDILTTSLHHHAAYDLAPHYYQWIRLHHGVIQQGDPSLELMLLTTKYYTFPTPAAAPSIYVQAHQSVHAIVGVPAL